MTLPASTALDRFRANLAECPLVGIIRGVRPDEVEAIGDALLEAGIRIIEVPLNSPDPLRSIERLARHANSRATIGAGTVLEDAVIGDRARIGARVELCGGARVWPEVELADGAIRFSSDL